jgi:hypothetical protein
MAYDKVKYLPAVKRIPDALWNEARLLILPSEKQDNIIRRPYSMALYMFWNVLRTGVNINGR